MGLSPQLLQALGPALGPSLNAPSDAATARRNQMQAIAAQPTPGRQMLGLPGTQQRPAAGVDTPDIQAIMQLIQALQGQPQSPGGVQQGGFSQFNL